MRYEGLADEIKAIGDVTDSRAKLIARDQTSKMNGAMTMLRQTSLGISRYIWQTAGDERVREEHADLDGQAFAWDAPPSEGNPGEPVNCRCVAIPVIDMDEGDGQGGEDGGDESGGLTLGAAVNTGLALAAIGRYFGEWASAYDAFNPDQPRDEHGRWTSGGGGSGTGGEGNGKVHVKLTGNELGTHGSTKELRRAAMAHAEKNLIGKAFTNASSGHTIKVTRQGMKHSLSGKNNPEVRLSVGLPQMLTNARYAGAKVPTEKHMQRGVTAMHQYVATVSMGAETFSVGIVTHEKDGGHEHYDHAIVASGVKGAERLGRLL
jgi:SPP1 gp7 family putative phage head morphogenesis protein